MEEKLAQSLLKKTKKDFDLLAEKYALSRPFPQEDVKRLIDLCQKGEKILDAGCGHGYLYPAFKEKQVQYYGVDFSEKLIKIAQKNFPEGNFFVANILNLPFSDNFFDKVFSISVLHHIPSEKFRIRFFEELKRVLKPKGKLILRVWNLWESFEGKTLVLKFAFLKIFKKSKLDLFDVMVPWKDQEGKVLAWRYVHCFFKKEIERLAKKTSFRIEKLWKEGKGKRANIYLVAEKTG